MIDDIFAGSLGTNTGELETLYAWISVQPDGKTGLFATQIGPMVGVNHSVMVKARPMIERALKRAPGYRARLVRYTAAEILEELS